MTTPIVVFAKAPEPGFAKTRLAARLLEHALAQAAAAALGPLELCTTPDAAHPWLQALAARHGAALTAQGDGDLGLRMHRALSRHRGALLIGSDVPALDAARLREAAAALATHDAVFVPALDGGYALVGMQRADRRCFDGIAWSTPQVMAQTRERLRGAGLRWAELAPVADIDEPADLLHLPRGWQVQR